jgi:hypothetical protein
MRKRQFLAVAVCSLLGMAFAQDNASPKNFGGTWQASFKGAVFCTLKITAGAEISATLSPGKVTVDDDGDLTEAEPSSPDGTFPILNPTIHGRTLSFGWRESGDDEDLRFEFKLTGDGEAELRLINEDNIKPIPLQRAAESRQ